MKWSPSKIDTQYMDMKKNLPRQEFSLKTGDYHTMNLNLLTEDWLRITCDSEKNLQAAFLTCPFGDGCASSNGGH